MQALSNRVGCHGIFASERFPAGTGWNREESGAGSSNLIFSEANY
jgi:hypothetical protein